jgi:hypothetical protein
MVPSILGLVVLTCACLACVPTQTAEFQVDHVIHIAVDGLRGSVIEDLGQSALPNLYRIRAEGAYTDNARTLREVTVTMPNTVAMFTGRPRDGAAGHGVSRNSDPGNSSITIHVDKGQYVPSVFDVVHDNGQSTAFFAGWNGFNYIDNSYDANSGAADVIGVDNGTDKIDTYNLRTNDDLQAQVTDLLNDLASDPYAYTLLHLHRTDSAGHGSGFHSSQYADAVRLTDVQLGRIMDFVNSNRDMSGNTAIVLSADHGGMGGGHGDINNLETFRIPFYVWIAGEQIGQELYILNSGLRADPGTGAPDYGPTLQPIRNGDSGSLALDLLGLSAVPGSTINAQQELRLQQGRIEFHDLVLLVDPATGNVQLRNHSAVDIAFDGYTLRSASDSLDRSNWNSLDDLDGDGGWRESNPSPGQLAELLQSGEFALRANQVIRLGDVFDAADGTRDLVFGYLPAGESETIAVPVIYATLPVNPDFNEDGTVDAADYVVWRKTRGATGIGSAADGDNNGLVDGHDYQVWRANFGRIVGASLAVDNVNAVPEPASCTFFLFTPLAALVRRGAWKKSFLGS